MYKVRQYAYLRKIYNPQPSHTFVPPNTSNTPISLSELSNISTDRLMLKISFVFEKSLTFYSLWNLSSQYQI